MRPRRTPRWIAAGALTGILLAAGAVSLLPAAPVAAKGASPTFRPRYVPVGGEAVGRLTSPRVDTSEPWRGYLVPARRWSDDDVTMFRTIPLPDLFVRPVAGPAVLIRFTVPQVEAGRYRVAMCSPSDPCRWRSHDALIAGRLTVVAEPEDAALWRTVDRLGSRIGELRWEVAYWSARSFGDRRWEVLQSRLAEVQREVAAISDRSRPVQAGDGPGLPRWVAGAFPLGALVLTIAAGRRRRLSR